MSLPVKPVVSQQETRRLLPLRSSDMGLLQESIYLETMSDPLCSDGAVAKLKNTIFRAQYLIKIYASSQEMRPEVLSAELSSDIDVQDLQWLIGRFEMADFSILPAVEVRSRLAIAGAWSKYVPEVNTNYLAGDFVENASKKTLATV